MAFPFICPPLQLGLDSRDGDTYISVPAKSGTTWTMNIFHQLRSGGDADFKDVYAEVPWAEFIEKPGQTMEDLLERWKALPADVPRGFKTHAGPGPNHTYRENAKYIVVMRNPEEAMASFKIFLEMHSENVWDLWKVPEETVKMITQRPFEDWFFNFALNFKPGPPGGEIDVPDGLLTVFFWSFLAGWWPLRNKPNVLMLHFNDMKSDHEGSIRKIAAHLGFEPTEEQWPKILEYTSFPWMKAHQGKFEIKTAPVEFLKPGAMIRKGAVADAKSDGMTDKVAAYMKESANKFVNCEGAADAIKFMYEGGPIPPG